MVEGDGGLENDYERMVPEFHRDRLIYAEHLTRYLAARPFVAGKDVLDIASGSGYGAQLLAGTARFVHGVDVDPDAVAYAERHYAAENVAYRVGDAVAIPLDDDSVDVVVTFETIEHIADHRAFLAEIKRVLRPGGVALVSTPNEREFSEGNHFHLHEFEYDELLGLCREHFAHVEPYFQSTWKYVAVGSEQELASDVDATLLNLAPKVPDRHLYFYLVCSDRQVSERVPYVGALGEHYSDRELNEREQRHARAEEALRDRERTLQARVDDLEALVAEQARELDDRAHKLLVHEQVAEEQGRRLADLAGRLADREGRLAEQAERLAEQDERIALLRDRLRRRTARLVRTRRRLEAAEGRLAAISGSRAYGLARLLGRLAHRSGLHRH